MNKLLCYGDSNTCGWDPSLPLGGRYDKAWVEYLQDQSGLRCVNLGLPGRRIPDNESRINPLISLIKSIEGDALCIMLGSNHCFLSPHHSPAETADKMDALLASLRQAFPLLPILLIGLPPMRLPGTDSEEWVFSVNRLYRALSEKDSLPYFDPLPLDLPLAFDGLHLTPEGHSKLADGLVQSSFISRQ